MFTLVDLDNDHLLIIGSHLNSIWLLQAGMTAVFSTCWGIRVDASHKLVLRDVAGLQILPRNVVLCDGVRMRAQFCLLCTWPC